MENASGERVTQDLNPLPPSLLPSPSLPSNPVQQPVRYNPKYVARTTADTPLTVKQTKFAAAVADGMPKAVAHREVGYAQQREVKAQQRRALDIANRPNVAA